MNKTQAEIVILYHRPPFDESYDDGVVNLSVPDKPNGIIPLLISYCSLVRGTTWVAGSTILVNNLIPLYDKIPTHNSDNHIVLRRVPLTFEEVDQFYYKSSKNGFWPLLHSFLNIFDISNINWDNFVLINERFAAVACEEVRFGGIVWIHDYNLWMAPKFIRQERPDVRIAFFFHTPFPPADIFNVLSFRKEIIESLLCCDMCNFNIPRYVQNFVSAACSNMDVRILANEPVGADFSSYGLALSEPFITKTISYQGRTVYLDACPEGTDNNLIAKKLKSAESLIHLNKHIEAIKGNKKLIFAASRIDYTKGIVEMLHCYRRFLLNESRPGEAILILVCVMPPSGMTTYNSVAKGILSLVEQINEEFKYASDKPIFFQTTSLSSVEMVAYMHKADVMWVNSLRDGMNIACEEYISVKRGNPGVLILSEFTGASVILKGAILTNPYVDSNMDEALNAALLMSIDEQRRRMKLLFERIKLSDVTRWSVQLNRL